MSIIVENLFLIFIIIHTYLLLAQHISYTTLSHYLDSTDLSPLTDMHGAIHTLATCTFILSSVH